MSKDSKRFTEAKKAVDPLRIYSPLEATRLLKALKTANFDETIEVHIKLGINPRHADQQVRGTLMLPYGTGKTVRVAVFAKGDKATEAEEAGAELSDISGGLTHTNEKTSLRYIRRRARKIATVATARQQSRTAGDDSGTP